MRIEIAGRPSNSVRAEGVSQEYWLARESGSERGLALHAANDAGDMESDRSDAADAKRAIARGWRSF